MTFSDDAIIIMTGGLVATACALLGVFLVLRRQALLGDAVSHAVLPGIVVVFLLTGSRAPLPVIIGAAAFALLCVLAIDAIRGTGLVKGDAAIGLVFPALFALGVLGIDRYAADIHLDLDSTIYGEIAFAPFRTVAIGDPWSRGRCSSPGSSRSSTCCWSPSSGGDSRSRPSTRRSLGRSARRPTGPLGCCCWR